MNGAQRTPRSDPASGPAGLTIRRGRLGDIARVLQIERAAFGPESYSASTFLAHLFRDRKGLLVAQGERGQVLGYALVRMGLRWLGPRRGGITSIAVDSAHRRQGIGRALLARALELLCEHGAAQVDLEVSVTNHPAQALYESFGFQRARLLPGYYGYGRDGVKMVLDMQPAQAGALSGAGQAAQSGRPGLGGDD
jgi:ribosomal-protein-alanine N-acetyltransferase